MWMNTVRSIPMNLLRALILYGWVAASLAAESRSAPLTLEKTILLDKVEGRIDHMAADIRRERLFVAALGNNTVEVVDLKGARVIRSLPGFAEPQGIAYVPEFERIFVANGQDGTCRIIDCTTW